MAADVARCATTSVEISTGRQPIAHSCQRPRRERVIQLDRPGLAQSTAGGLEDRLGSSPALQLLPRLASNRPARLPTSSRSKPISTDSHTAAATCCRLCEMLKYGPPSRYGLPSAGNRSDATSTARPRNRAAPSSASQRPARLALRAPGSRRSSSRRFAYGSRSISSARSSGTAPPRSRACITSTRVMAAILGESRLFR